MRHRHRLVEGACESLFHFILSTFYISIYLCFQDHIFLIFILYLWMLIFIFFTGFLLSPIFLHVGISGSHSLDLFFLSSLKPTAISSSFTALKTMYTLTTHKFVPTAIPLIYIANCPIEGPI